MKYDINIIVQGISESLLTFFFPFYFGGTPVKRICDGLFCPLCFFVIGFDRHYRGCP